jgi:hypothetical protein
VDLAAGKWVESALTYECASGISSRQMFTVYSYEWTLGGLDQWYTEQYIDSQTPFGVAFESETVYTRVFGVWRGVVDWKLLDAATLLPSEASALVFPYLDFTNASATIAPVSLSEVVAPTECDFPDVLAWRLQFTDGRNNDYSLVFRKSDAYKWSHPLLKWDVRVWNMIRNRACIVQLNGSPLRGDMTYGFCIAPSDDPCTLQVQQCAFTTDIPYDKYVRAAYLYTAFMPGSYLTLTALCDEGEIESTPASTCDVSAWMFYWWRPGVDPLGEGAEQELLLLTWNASTEKWEFSSGGRSLTLDRVADGENGEANFHLDGTFPKGGTVASSFSTGAAITCCYFSEIVGSIDFTADEWKRSTAYAQYDLVWVASESKFYGCTAAHTSGTGTIQDDIADWLEWTPEVRLGPYCESDCDADYWDISGSFTYPLGGKVYGTGLPAEVNAAHYWETDNYPTGGEEANQIAIVRVHNDGAAKFQVIFTHWPAEGTEDELAVFRGEFTASAPCTSAGSIQVDMYAGEIGEGSPVGHIHVEAF